ncbi:MAG: hypothetical protein NVS2B16_26770 [Chloroflexota bacterium]
MMVKHVEKYHEFAIPPSIDFVRRYLAKDQEKVVVIKNNADRERLLGRLTTL